MSAPAVVEGPTPKDLVAGLDSGPWPVWLAACFPHVFTAPMPAFQVEAWDWCWKTTRHAAPEPPSLVMAAFRGSAKSTTAEAMVVALLASGRRKYCVYVSGTQNSADDHLDSIAKLALESPSLGAFHPEMGSAFLEDRARQSRWNSKRIEFGNGAVVDAAGLDTKVRGKKAGETRPDVIVFDDIDEPTDSPRVRQRKLDRIAGILGGGATQDGTVVIFVQNPIQADSIMSQTLDRRIGLLSDRKVIGPVPMVANATYSVDAETGRTIINGDPTWPAVWPLRACQADLDRMGVQGYRQENQNDLQLDVVGALLNQTAFVHEPVSLADMARVIVSVDPAVTAKPGSDDTGIVAVGKMNDGRWAVLEDRSAVIEVSKWPGDVDALACEVKASEVVIEGNNGGDLNKAAVLRAQADRLKAAREAVAEWEKTAASEVDRGREGEGTHLAAVEAVALARTALAGQHVYTVRLVWATEPKEIRAGRPAARYQTHEVIHAQPFPKLERQWTGWVPGVSKESPGGLDATVHGLTELGCIPEDPSETSFASIGSTLTF